MINIQEFPDYPSVYDSVGDIPDHLRLRTYEDEYADIDLWDEFFEDQYAGRGFSEAHIATVRNAGERWRDFCAEQNRHHAFVDPDLVKKWCEQLSKEYSKTTIQTDYLQYLVIFYRFLTWNVDYPHIYNPVVFAIHEYDIVQSIWTSEGRKLYV